MYSIIKLTLKISPNFVEVKFIYVRKSQALKSIAWEKFIILTISREFC